MHKRIFHERFLELEHKDRQTDRQKTERNPLSLHLKNLLTKWSFLHRIRNLKSGERSPRGYLPGGSRIAGLRREASPPSRSVVQNDAVRVRALEKKAGRGNALPLRYELAMVQVATW